MSTNIKGFNQFNTFKTGQIIKVHLSNQDVYKGVYIGTHFYDVSNKYSLVTTGQFMVYYSVINKKALVIDIFDYCRCRRLEVVSVGSTRLMKGLSDFLREYYRSYMKYQALQKQAIELRNKTVDVQKELDQFATKGIDGGTQARIQEEEFKQDPIAMVRSKLKTSKVGFDVDEYSNAFHFANRYGDVQVAGNQIGASTYLEYDDTRFVDDEPKTDKVEQVLHKYGYTGVQQSDFAKLVNKYKSVITISGPYLTADLRDGKGDRFIVCIEFKMEFKKPNKVTEQLIDALVLDLKNLHTKSNRQNRTNRW